MKSAIYTGYVRHRRFSPVAHAFTYRLFMMYVDLEELPTVFEDRWFWSVDRTNLASFKRVDHVGDPIIPLDESIRQLVETRTGSRPTGPIRLLTHLRYFGSSTLSASTIAMTSPIVTSRRSWPKLRIRLGASAIVTS